MEVCIWCGLCIGAQGVGRLVLGVGCRVFVVFPPPPPPPPKKKKRGGEGGLCLVQTGVWGQQDHALFVLKRKGGKVGAFSCVRALQ
jgi:hypothetical protein